MPRFGVSRSGPLRLRRSEGRICRISMESADDGRTPRVRNDRRRVDAGCVWRLESNMAWACEAVAPACRRTLRLLVASNRAVPPRFNHRLLRRLSRSRTGHGRNGETGYDDERHRMHPDTQRDDREAQEVSRSHAHQSHSQRCVIAESPSSSCILYSLQDQAESKRSRCAVSSSAVRHDWLSLPAGLRKTVLGFTHLQSFAKPMTCSHYR